MTSTVDYRLAKRAVVRRLQEGELSTDQVCDAHPELLRASTFIGTPTRRTCPVCTLSPSTPLNHPSPTPRVVETTWLYGEGLRQKNGHLVEDSADLADYERRFPSFNAWTVECCISCGWNHLISKRLCGFSHLPGGRITRHTRRMQRTGRD